MTSNMLSSGPIRPSACHIGAACRRTFYAALFRNDQIVFVKVKNVHFDHYAHCRDTCDHRYNGDDDIDCRFDMSPSICSIQTNLTTHSPVAPAPCPWSHRVAHRLMPAESRADHSNSHTCLLIRTFSMWPGQRAIVNV